MTIEWQRVTWDDEENVSGPEFFIKQSMSWPVLVRFEEHGGEIGKGVSNRYNLFAEESNYKSIMVAPVVWPEEAGNE
jgi:hypothetical protein